MRRFWRNTIILLSPLLLMVLINESVRSTQEETSYIYRGQKTINSVAKNPDRCSWICHHKTTQVCQGMHVKYLQPFFNYTDPLYKGIIELLHKSGNYQWANIFFLVVLIPGITWLFIVKSLNAQQRINQLKNE